MATERLSLPLGPSFAATQLAALQGSGRLSKAIAADGPAGQGMASTKLTLPPRSKSFHAPSDAAQKLFFEEDVRRSTLMEKLPSAGPSQDLPHDVQSSNNSIVERLSSTDESTVFERLSSVDDSMLELSTDHSEKAQLEPASQMLADRLAGIQTKGLKLEEVAKNIEKAKSVSVDPAKRTFWQKFGGAAVALGVVALFTALTITTGGAAAIAGLSAAGVMFAKHSADTYCALKVLQNKNAERRGEEPPHSNVPMGADSIGNICYSAIAKLNKQKLANGQMSLAEVKDKAKSLSFGINTALKVVSFSAGSVAGIASGAALLPLVASIAFSAATLAVSIALDKVKQQVEESGQLYADEKLPQRMLKFCEDYIDLLEKADQLPEEQRGALLSKIGSGLEALDADFDELEARLLTTQEKLETPSSTAAQAIKGGLAEGFLFAGAVQAGRRGLEFIPVIQSAGMSLESSAATIMIFKSAYDSWQAINAVSQRSQAIRSHQDTISNLNIDAAQFI